MVKKKACIFISGSGTNLKSIIKNSRDYNFPIKINLVITNKKNAGGIYFAKKFSDSSSFHFGPCNCHKCVHRGEIISLTILS